MRALLCVGNARLGDDALGPVFARAFRDPAWRVWNGGIAPENCASSIRRAAPTLLVILDATDFPGAPGEIREFPLAALEAHSFSTHAQSLALLARYLAPDIPAIRFFGIRPATLLPSPTPRLSPPVRQSLRHFAALLRSL